MFKHFLFFIASLFLLAPTSNGQTSPDIFPVRMFSSNCSAMDTLAVDDMSLPLRMSAQIGLVLFDAEEHTNRKHGIFLFGVGLVPDTWWMPAPHLFLSVVGQKYERIFVAHEWRERNFVSLYPSVKLAHFLVLGFGFSTGKEKLTLDYGDGTGPFTRTSAISAWRPFVAIDYDLEVYRDFHVATGIYLQHNVFFVALGVSVHL